MTDNQPEKEEEPKWIYDDKGKSQDELIETLKRLSIADPDAVEKVRAHEEEIAAISKEPVKIGNVPDVDMERHKKTYGNSLVSVRDLGSGDMENGIETIGQLYKGVWEALERNTDVFLEKDVRLIGYVHAAEIPSLPELPFDPELSYVRIKGLPYPTEQINKLFQKAADDATTEKEALERMEALVPEAKKLELEATISSEEIATMKSRFEVDDLFITKLRPLVLNYRLSLPDDRKETPLRLFMQIRPKEINTAWVYDSVDRVKVYAISYRLPLTYGLYMISDLCIQATKCLTRGLMEGEKKKPSDITDLNIAWYQHPGTDLFCIYMSLPPTPVAEEDGEEAKYKKIFAEKFMATELFETPPDQFPQALAAVANISLPMLDLPDPTEKPADSFVTPF